MLGTTTPTEISESVLKFCGELESTEMPIFLRVQPARKAIPNECFSNVREYIAAHGGSRRLGWLVWETPGIMLEATLHAVWRSADGTVVDVTPQADGESEILFLPDPKVTIDPNKPDGEVVGMRRFPLVDDPLLHEFIRLGERKDAVKVRTQGRLTRPDLIEMAEIERQQIPLQEKLAVKYRGEIGALKVAPLSYGPSYGDDVLPYLATTAGPRVMKVGRNDPCPCGSGKKYKKCHGR